MWETLESWFAGRFMPHGHCYLWSPTMVWLQVTSNLVIATAYIAISATIALVIRRIRDIPFSRMYAAFGVFIVTCGLSHLLDVVTIWHPIYWLDAAVRSATAIASAGTAVMLVRLVPKAVALAHAAATAHERGLRLESTYEELAVAHARAVELERTRADLFANVSHELRTPLTLVLGPTDKLLAREDVGGETRRELETVARSARTLLKHVNDLLDVAKLDAHKLEPLYARVDVAELVHRVASQFEGLARERGTRLEVHAPKARIAEIDADQIERVVANLLGNAFKFGTRGGTVRVSLDTGATEEVRIEVADNGPGIPEGLRARIFERFTQGDAGATRAHGGTGLGLAIVRELVSLQGGDVRIEDAPEGGALFVVTLPARAPSSKSVSPATRRETPRATAALALEVATARAATRDADVRHAATLTIQRGRATPTRLGSAPLVAPGEPTAAATDPAPRPLAIIAEDNADMNDFIAEALGGDLEVLRAHDGAQALMLAQQRTPDIVVTDIMMPAKSGEELMADLRADPALLDVPVLVLTAQRDDELRVRLLEQGARDYVTKPFGAEELRARVANLVAMKRTRDVLRSELASRETDLERLAKELGARKRDLETAITSLRVARDHAEEASAHKTDFLAMVSHELRTPLTTVQLLVDRVSAASADLPPSLEKSVARMDSAVQRLTSLVESLLHYARLQSGRIGVHAATADARAILEDALDEVRPQAQAKGLDLRLAIDPSAQGPDGAAPDLALETDATLARLIVGNLLTNAVKFTARGAVTATLGRIPAGRADVPASLTGGVILRVEDTGAGIPAPEQARIFDPFVRLEPARHAHVPGVGLGLSLVRDLVDTLGGVVIVSSEVGVGTTFEVLLPSSMSRARSPTPTPPWLAPS
jgi:signal transduction histidine kinase